MGIGGERGTRGCCGSRSEGIWYRTARQGKVYAASVIGTKLLLYGMRSKHGHEVGCYPAYAIAAPAYHIIGLQVLTQAGVEGQAGHWAVGLKGGGRPVQDQQLWASAAYERVVLM